MAAILFVRLMGLTAAFQKLKHHVEQAKHAQDD